MSYVASNTPNPTSSTQIGYSQTYNLTPATIITSGTQASISTFIGTIPIGVWLLTTSIYSNSLLSDFSTTQSSVQVTGSFGVLIANNEVELQTGYNTIFLPLTTSFYSNGSSPNITVTLSITGNGIGSTTAGTITLIKIA